MRNVQIKIKNTKNMRELYLLLSETMDIDRYNAIVTFDMLLDIAGDAKAFMRDNLKPLMEILDYHIAKSGLKVEDVFSLIKKVENDMRDILEANRMDVFDNFFVLEINSGRIILEVEDESGVEIEEII